MWTLRMCDDQIRPHSLYWKQTINGLGAVFFLQWLLSWFDGLQAITPLSIPFSLHLSDSQATATAYAATTAVHTTDYVRVGSNIVDLSRIYP